MNGTRAREIRKKIYGKGGMKPVPLGAIYRLIQSIKKVFVLDKEGNPVKVDKVTRQLICIGKRAEYKQAKKQYKEGLTNGSMRHLQVEPGR